MRDIESGLLSSECSNRAIQAAVLPDRGCDAQKCIKPLAVSRWIFNHYRKDSKRCKVVTLSRWWLQNFDYYWGVVTQF